MKKILFLVFQLMFLIGSSQTNLLPNPSFEFTTGCPNSSADWNLCSNWNNVNMNLGAGFWGSPDFYHSCGTGQTAPPLLFSGTCPPQAGVAMMSLVLYNMGYAEYREYLASPLLCPMQPGNTYTLSFWLSNGTQIKSPWTISNIGAHFSVGALSQSGYLPINVTPQCEIVTNVVSTGWTQYTFTVTATAAWNYITIGAFRPDASNNVTLSWPNPGGPASAYANYFIDNISVLAPTIGSPVIVAPASIPASGSICAGQSATLSAAGASSYLWSTGSNSFSTVVSPNVTSTYTVVGSSSGSCGVTSGSATISILVNPLPVVTTPGTLFICSGQTATISVSGAQSYLWSNNASTQNIVVSSTANVIYTVTGTTNGCSTSNTVGVNLLQNPTVSVAGQTLVCIGKSTTLTASGASNYQWSNSTSNSTLLVTPFGTTTYTVTGSMGTFSCSGSAIITVSVSECMGLQNYSPLETKFKISPNPIVEECNLFYLGASPISFVLKVFNSYGEQVLESGLNTIGEADAPNNFVFSATALSDGIYFLHINYEGRSQIVKVIKK